MAMEDLQQKQLTQKEAAPVGGDGCNQLAAPPMVEQCPSVNDCLSSPQSVWFYDSAMGTIRESRFVRGYTVGPFYSAGEDVPRTKYVHGTEKDIRVRAAAKKYMVLVCCTPYEGMDEEFNVYFRSFPSFKGVEMEEGKEGLAFVEYDDEDDRTLAVECFHGFEVRPEITLKVYKVK